LPDRRADLRLWSTRTSCYTGPASAEGESYGYLAD